MKKFHLHEFNQFLRKDRHLQKIIMIKQILIVFKRKVKWDGNISDNKFSDIIGMLNFMHCNMLFNKNMFIMMIHLVKVTIIMKNTKSMTTITITMIIITTIIITITITQRKRRQLLNKEFNLMLINNIYLRKLYQKIMGILLK